jgi:zinc protease
MSIIRGINLIIVLLILLGTMKAADKIYPYRYEMRDLPNDLRVVVIPTAYPNIVSLQIPVQVGSRNEIEAGKSGFAHFFEHMMFRGTEKYPSAEYTQILKNAGANQNAYTTDDYTNYYITFSKEDLETVLELEADRFRNLKYSSEDFKTEARAVLGEYNKNYADPVRKLFETQRKIAFKDHSYKHTTMGFIEDIEDMPNQFEYSRKFFDRYYRPEKICIIIAGDVQPTRVFQLVEKHWGGWKRGLYSADIPQDPQPEGAVYEHINWNTKTPPWLAVSFHGPAFSQQGLDMVAMTVISDIAFSQSSDLYQKLVIREQKVDNLYTNFPNRIDPHLLTVYTRVKQIDDMWLVRDEILNTFAQLRSRTIAANKIKDVKSHLRYSFANRLTNSASIASAQVRMMTLTRDPETINRQYQQLDRVTAATIHQMANTYFTDERLVVVTLSSESPPHIISPHGSIDEFVSKNEEEPAEIETVLLPSDSPIINFRILFNVGSALDQQGKSGLAKLTAQMISAGSSKNLKYDEFQKLLYPMAGTFNNQVDKEMTVFLGSIHKDNLSNYYQAISDMLLLPDWDEDDFRRVKDNMINYVDISLKRNNDEELGKEVLYEFIYKNHPYGRLTEGHVNDLERITLEDVKTFYRENYTRENLVLGLAGDYGDKFLSRIKKDMIRLPLWPAAKIQLPKPVAIDGYETEIIQKETRATAISFGFPVNVTRAQEDFTALWLIRSYLGEHRSSNSYLYQRIRKVRGMNYGDYAYIEYFPRGMFQMYPSPNLGRQHQIFQVWIRPVRPEQAHFATRVAIYELNKLIEQGMTQEDFEATRNFLKKYVNLLISNQSRQLGYAIDSRYYGIKEFTKFISEGLSQLTLEKVNAAIKIHLQTQDIKFVFITKDAEDLRNILINNISSPITYDADKPQSLIDEDEILQDYFLKFENKKVRIRSVEGLFGE